MSHLPPHHIHRAPHPTLPGVTASSGSMPLQKVSSQLLPFSTPGFDHLFSKTPFQVEDTQGQAWAGARDQSRTKN